MAASVAVAVPDLDAPQELRPHQDTVKPQRGRFLLLCLGAVMFLFPFYYMVIGSFQEGRTSPCAGWSPTRRT